MRFAVVAIGLLVAGFSGCVEGIPVAADVVGQGQWGQGTLKDVRFPCDGAAHVDAGAQGQGHLVITVYDANGASKAALSINGQGQEGLDKGVEGAAGEWRLTVQVKDYDWGMGTYYGGDPYQGIDFQGQYAAVVMCNPGE